MKDEELAEMEAVFAQETLLWPAQTARLIAEVKRLRELERVSTSMQEMDGFVAGMTARVEEWKRRAEEAEKRSQLRWTTERPTVPGAYWYENAIGMRGVTLVVELDAQLHVRESAIRWAGPIPEPKP